MSDAQQQKLLDILHTLDDETRAEFSVLWENLAVIKMRNRFAIATGKRPTSDNLRLLALASDNARDALWNICMVFDTVMI